MLTSTVLVQSHKEWMERKLALATGHSAQLTHDLLLLFVQSVGNIAFKGNAAPSELFSLAAYVSASHPGVFEAHLASMKETIAHSRKIIDKPPHGYFRVCQHGDTGEFGPEVNELWVGPLSALEARFSVIRREENIFELRCPITELELTGKKWIEKLHYGKWVRMDGTTQITIE